MLHPPVRAYFYGYARLGARAGDGARLYPSQESSGDFGTQLRELRYGMETQSGDMAIEESERGA